MEGFTSKPAAIAGYPIVTGSSLQFFMFRVTLKEVTVPMGFQPDSVPASAANPTVANGPGMPFGVAFVGTAFSEYQLISYAYAYEQATHHRLQRLAYGDAIPKTRLADIVQI